MCPTPNKDAEVESGAPPTPAPVPASGCGGSSFTNTSLVTLLTIVTICVIIMVGELASLISFASRDAEGVSGLTLNLQSDGTTISSASISDAGVMDAPSTPLVARGVNVCEGKKPDLPNVECVVDAIENVGPQAGANVTQGYNGSMEVDSVPITTPYWMNGMCPVNVHWHLGAEHLSVGEYDETGTGPAMDGLGVGYGHQCKHYNANDPKFTRPYNWQYCKDMQVGQTYEIHWPHSAAGACGTPDQYQTPFYDGVFCVDGVLTDTASQIGVQAQVFTVVNDDSYYWPDLFRGMIVDGEMGSDIAKYTGSTTGDSRSNEICSQYSPITWQVDRKCHMISASSFDKLCYDMLQQRDDMSSDLRPQGARETVSDELAANNFANRFLRA